MSNHNTQVYYVSAYNFDGHHVFSDHLFDLDEARVAYDECMETGNIGKIVLMELDAKTKSKTVLDMMEAD